MNFSLRLAAGLFLLSSALVTGCTGGDDDDASTSSSSGGNTQSSSSAATSMAASGSSGGGASSQASSQAVASSQAGTSSSSAAASSSGGGGSSQAGSGPTFTADVHPVFRTKCTPCHSAGMSGGHQMGNSNVDVAYPGSQLPSSVCQNLKKGECAKVRIQNGSMPQGRGCTGNPVTDANNNSCLTQAEQDALSAWIDAGMPK